MSWITSAPTIPEMAARMSEGQRQAAIEERWIASGLDYYGCNLSSAGCSCSSPTDTSIAVREYLLRDSDTHRMAETPQEVRSEA